MMTDSMNNNNNSSYYSLLHENNDHINAHANTKPVKKSKLKG